MWIPTRFCVMFFFLVNINAVYLPHLQTNLVLNKIINFLIIFYFYSFLGLSILKGLKNNYILKWEKIYFVKKEFLTFK